MKRILIIGDGSDTIFLRNFCKWLKIKASEDFILDFYSFTGYNKELDEICDQYYVSSIRKKKFFSIKFISAVLSVFYANFELKKYLYKHKKYDIINLHLIESQYVLFPNLITSRCVTFITSFWGEEWNKVKLFRSNSLYNNQLRKILSKDNVFITHGADTVLNRFLEKFPDFRKKIMLAKFASESIELIKSQFYRNKSSEESKVFMGLNPQKISIAIGYCGRLEYQHLNVIDLLLKDDWIKAHKDIFQLVFPMTYGCNMKYINKIESKLMKHDFEFKIYKKFMSLKEVAEFRNAINILINLPSTDGASNSLIEHLCMGAITINGSWLPYQYFKDLGFKFYEIDSYNELPQKLVAILQHFDAYQEECSFNKSISLDNFLWEKNIMSWIKIYKID